MTALPSAEATGALASTENGRRIKELIIRTDFLGGGVAKRPDERPTRGQASPRMSAGHWGVFGRLPAPRRHEWHRGARGPCRGGLCGLNREAPGL